MPSHLQQKFQPPLAVAGRLAGWIASLSASYGAAGASAGQPRPHRYRLLPEAAARHSKAMALVPHYGIAAGLLGRTPSLI